MERFSPGAVLGRSFSLWGKHFVPFTLVAVGIQLPTILLAAARPGGEGDGLVSMLSNLLGFVVTGALTSGVLRALRGEAPRASEMLRTGFGRVWRVFAVSFLSGLAIVLGLVLLVVPGVLLACALAVAVPVVVVEERGANDALSRSFALTKGSRVGVFLVGAVLLVFMIAVAAGSYAAIGLGGEAAGVSPGLLGAVQQALLEVGATPMAIALAVAYHDLRVLKEGVDTAQVAVVFE